MAQLLEGLHEAGQVNRRPAAIAVLGTVAVAVAATITGTTGPDTLVGTPQNDTINGLAGADTIIGLADNDRIDGGADDDNIQGDGSCPPAGARTTARPVARPGTT
jgi:Ca2+-binding RTX toxin-like protein